MDSPDELTADRYDQILVRQLACEELGIDNPDWHAATSWWQARAWCTSTGVPPGRSATTNAIRRGTGAAGQVRELAWSFQDADLAERTVALHDRTTGDGDHMEQLRARDLVR